jgi:flagellar motor switch protein FliN/FliY
LASSPKHPANPDTPVGPGSSPAATDALSASSAAQAQAAASPAGGASGEINLADIDALLAGASGTSASRPGSMSNNSGDPPAKPFEAPAFDAAPRTAVETKKVTMLNDVGLRVKIELGRTRMPVEDVLKLGEGSVVELDKLAGDPVDIYVNERLMARGEVLVLNDCFCVRVSEVLSHDPHRVCA